MASALPAPARAEDERPGDRRMAFGEHLAELRDRLKASVIAIFVATGIAYVFRGLLFAVLARPLLLAWAQQPADAHLPDPNFVYTSPTEGFMVLLKIAVVAGLFLASPYVFWQLWKFISPGLYKREKKMALPFILVAAGLFIGGAVFCYVYILPASYKFFLGYPNDSMDIIRDGLSRLDVLGHRIHLSVAPTFKINPMLTMDEYFGLTSMLLLVFGLAFELPLVLAVLAILGIVSPRGLWRFNRYFILIAFIAGAVLTPGDMVVATVAMGGALTVLYNLSIVVAVLFHRRRRKEEAAQEAAQTG